MSALLSTPPTVMTAPRIQLFTRCLDDGHAASTVSNGCLPHVNTQVCLRYLYTDGSASPGEVNNGGQVTQQYTNYIQVQPYCTGTGNLGQVLLSSWCVYKTCCFLGWCVHMLLLLINQLICRPLWIIKCLVIETIIIHNFLCYWRPWISFGV